MHHTETNRYGGSCVQDSVPISPGFLPSEDWFKKTTIINLTAMRLGIAE